jgi:hypothetical protein
MARKNRMSRRDFLRSAAALGGGLIASQFLSGCQPQAEPGEYKRGIKKNANLKFWLWNTYAPEADDVLENGIKECPTGPRSRNAARRHVCGLWPRHPHDGRPGPGTDHGPV